MPNEQLLLAARSSRWVERVARLSYPQQSLASESAPQQNCGRYADEHRVVQTLSLFDAPSD